MADYRLVYEDEDILVADKQGGLPTVPIKENDEKDTLLMSVASDYPEILECCGRRSFEGGVLHRLDTATAGLVVIARNQEAYNYYWNLQQMGMMTKEYYAESSLPREPGEGFGTYPYEDPTDVGGREVVIGSMFRPYGPGRKEVRPVLSDYSRIIVAKANPAWYTTKVCYLGENSYCCTITKGFRHQIRAHLAWAGHPIDGDYRYLGFEQRNLKLRCVALTFTDRFGSPVEIRDEKEDW